MENKNQKIISPELEKYGLHLKELVSKSQDAFEKQLSYISAGSLSVSMAFIKNVVGDLDKTSSELFLIAGWSLMGITLMINLLSHVFTSNCHNKTIGEIGDNKYDYKVALCRHNNIKKINYISIATLIAGISSILFFISKNI